MLVSEGAYIQIIEKGHQNSAYLVPYCTSTS